MTTGCHWLVVALCALLARCWASRVVADYPPTSGSAVIPQKVQVGNLSREILSAEDVAWLEQLDIPPDRPEIFSRAPVESKGIPQWIDGEMKRKVLLYARLASAAYCEQHSVVKWTCGERCQKTPGLRIVEYFGNERTDVAGFLALSETTKEIIVAFRGSRTIKNWLYNLYISKRTVPWKLNCFGIRAPKVHQGFLLAYESVNPAIFSTIRHLVRQHPRYAIHVTGHSLGGALATICAMELNDMLSFKTHVRFTTFQSPRIGNEAFARLIYYHFPDPYDRIRVTNGRDIVMRLPPYFMGFRHAAMELFIPPQASHNSTALVCDPAVGEDPRCANAFVAYSIDDHLSLAWGLRFGVPCR